MANNETRPVLTAVKRTEADDLAYNREQGYINLFRAITYREPRTASGKLKAV